MKNSLNSKLNGMVEYLSVSGSTNEYLATCVIKPKQWVIDLGASDHMTGDAGMLNDYVYMGRATDITVVNCSSLKVCEKVDTPFPGLPLTSVLHTPKNPLSLLSINRITRKLHCSVTFFSDCCFFSGPED